MKKRSVGKKLSRGSGARRALFRALIRAQVLYGKIITTKTKAKLIQGKLDKVINLAKKKDLASRRRLYAILGNDRVITDILFQKVAPNFLDRVGGYTKLTNLPRRRGDQAEMARLEWAKEINEDDKKKKTKKDTKTKGKEKKKDTKK